MTFSSIARSTASRWYSVSPTIVTRCDFAMTRTSAPISQPSGLLRRDFDMASPRLLELTTFCSADCRRRSRRTPRTQISTAPVARLCAGFVMIPTPRRSNGRGACCERTSPRGSRTSGHREARAAAVQAWTAEGVEVHVEGVAGLNQSYKGDLHPVGSLRRLHRFLASTKNGGHLRGKCFSSCGVKTAAAELKKGHCEALEEDAARVCAFVSRPRSSRWHPGRSCRWPHLLTRRLKSGSQHDEPIHAQWRGSSAAESGGIEYAVYDDHEPRIQENAELCTSSRAA